jgi:hypothetical protein
VAGPVSWWCDGPGVVVGRLRGEVCGLGRRLRHVHVEATHARAVLVVEGRAVWRCGGLAGAGVSFGSFVGPVRNVEFAGVRLGVRFLMLMMRG